MDEFKIKFYTMLGHIGDPALIFAAGAAAGLIIYLLLSKMKKYFVFFLTILLIVVFALYISGKKLSDIKNLDMKKTEKIEEKMRSDMRSKMKENIPGMTK